jgi:hypothetical protein
MQRTQRSHACDTNETSQGLFGILVHSVIIS